MSLLGGKATFSGLNSGVGATGDLNSLKTAQQTAERSRWKEDFEAVLICRVSL